MWRREKKDFEKERKKWQWEKRELQLKPRVSLTSWAS